MFSQCGCVSVCFFVVLVLRGFLGGAWGRLWDPLGATLASLGHLGGATGHGKSADDKTWCAMVMVFWELLIFQWFYDVF